MTRPHLRSGNSPHLLCGGKVQFFDFPLWTPVRYFISFLFKLSIQASIRGFFYVVVDCKRIDEILGELCQDKRKIDR